MPATRQQVLQLCETGSPAWYIYRTVVVPSLYCIVHYVQDELESQTQKTPEKDVPKYACCQAAVALSSEGQGA